MRQETPQEKAYHDMLSPDLGANAHVSFGHQENLRIIQTHLQTFYGQRADWSQCLKAYFQSRSHQASFCNSKCCEDIPDISVEQLYAMIQEGKRYQDDVERFLRLNQQIKDAGTCANIGDIYQAAAILGILPDQKTSGLFSYVVSLDGISSEEIRNIKKNISENIELFVLIIDLFSTLFVPGIQLTFPHIGTAMTQQRNKYFYRGENMFYGSSKPGIFRTAKVTPLQRIADLLILNEACFFLSQFDAVQKWGLSDVNRCALAQHYGIKTPLMDITTDLRTALFFACCKYENHKWRPLAKKDFEHIPNGTGTKDLRYGILYRSPTEITDIQWALTNDETGLDLIAPIGYQPFMRCSTQHGYALYVRNESYDLLHDPLFDKFRIRHDEEFCQWIFDEMKQGGKVYPHDDIPKVAEYMDAIRNSHIISQTTFEHFVEHNHYSEQKSREIRQQLQREGYTILKGEVEHIHNNQLRKINKKYSIDVAYSKVDIPAVARPMVTLPSDLLVEPDGNGGWVLVAGQGKDS